MKVRTLTRHFPAPAYLRFPLCGLDISDRAVKYVELLLHGQELRLGKHGEEEIPAGIVKGGVIIDQEKLTDIISGVREKTGLDFFHVSLPEEKAYLVEMSVPEAAGNDLRGAIELHLEENVPIPVNEVVFDYEIVHPPAQGLPTYIVAVSVVETTFAQSYLEVLGKSNITPLGFEFESEALTRAVVKKGKKGVTMIVDIGREQSNLSIVSSGIVRLTSSISLGGNALSRAIALDLKVDEKEATSLKEGEGLSRRAGGKAPFESIVRVASVLRDEMYQRLIYWDTGRVRSNSKDRVSEIILCGGNANVPGLVEYLTGGIDVPVSIADPWTNILSLNEYIPELKAREALKYCAALGLALRGVES